MNATSIRACGFTGIRVLPARVLAVTEQIITAAIPLHGALLYDRCRIRQVKNGVDEPEGVLGE